MGNRHQYRGLPALAALLLLVSCGSAPAPKQAAAPDPTIEPEYQAKVERLARLNRQSEALMRKKKLIDAGEQVTVGQIIAGELLAAPRPSFAAVEAAADCDTLYARLLLAKEQPGHARMLFQKNRSRWKNWTPATDATRKKLAEAEAGIADCDRRMASAR